MNEIPEQKPEMEMGKTQFLQQMSTSQRGKEKIKEQRKCVTKFWQRQV